MTGTKHTDKDDEQQKENIKEYPRKGSITSLLLRDPWNG